MMTASKKNPVPRKSPRPGTDADDSRRGESATVRGTQADYVAFLPAAMAIPAAHVVRMRADAQLAAHNVRVGVASVLAVSARASRLPETDLDEITSLPRIALAVIFASTLIGPVADAAMADLLKRATPLRARLLTTAESLVVTGHLPGAEVERIRAGRGRFDTARDLVALSALYGAHAAELHGKHPFRARDFEEAAEVGTALLELLTPKRARPASSPAAGLDERDRLWTLLVAGHERLTRAGVYLFGAQDARKAVPALQANRGARPKGHAPVADTAPLHTDPNGPASRAA